MELYLCYVDTNNFCYCKITACTKTFLMFWRASLGSIQYPSCRRKKSFNHSDVFFVPIASDGGMSLSGQPVEGRSPQTLDSRAGRAGLCPKVGQYKQQQTASYLLYFVGSSWLDKKLCFYELSLYLDNKILIINIDKDKTACSYGGL